MLILHDAMRPHNITSLTEPIASTHFWVFSGHMLDFKLESLDFLEETTGPTMTVEINGAVFEMPASWNILVVERETYTIDTVPIASCATFDHEAILFNPHDTKLMTTTIKIIDYSDQSVCIHPMVPKGSAFAIPVAKNPHKGQTHYYSILATPYDLHRYIGGCAVGEILG